MGYDEPRQMVIGKLRKGNRTDVIIFEGKKWEIEDTESTKKTRV